MPIGIPSSLYFKSCLHTSAMISKPTSLRLIPYQPTLSSMPPLSNFNSRSAHSHILSSWHHLFRIWELKLSGLRFLQTLLRAAITYTKFTYIFAGGVPTILGRRPTENRPSQSVDVRLNETGEGGMKKQRKTLTERKRERVGENSNCW